MSWLIITSTGSLVVVVCWQFVATRPCSPVELESQQQECRTNTKDKIMSDTLLKQNHPFLDCSSTGASISIRALDKTGRLRLHDFLVEDSVVTT